MKNLVQACLLALLVWNYPAGYPKVNTAKAEEVVMEFKVYDFHAKEVYGPYKSDYEPQPVKPKIVKTDCECVPWVKAQFGITRSIGAAKNWQPNTQIPTIGAVVITRESSLGHVGLVTDIQNGYLIISEKNYVGCTVTHGRKLDVNSPLIIGYWTLNN